MQHSPGVADLVVIEDDTATQALLAAVARRCGFTPRLASDGEQAIALILAHSPRAVILDLALPRVCGLEVLRFMRRTNPKLLPCTIVIAAGETPDDADLHHVRCVMRKPVSLDDLCLQLDGCGVDN